MNNLQQAIIGKKERIRLSKTNDRVEHIFLSIINNTDIFKNAENKILGLMIFNLCQDSLTAIRIGNYNLVNHYKNRIKSILNRMTENQITKNGISSIIYPMYSYYDYKKEKFNKAENNMFITINSLKQLSPILKESVLPPLFEQYKNLALIYFKNNETQNAFTTLEYLSTNLKSEIAFNDFDSEENIHLAKNLYNNIINEILLKINSFDKENYKINFEKVITLLCSSKLYSVENQLINKFLLNNLDLNDSYKIINANLPPVVEGTFLNSIEYSKVEDKETINKYFIETHNISL